MSLCFQGVEIPPRGIDSTFHALAELVVWNVAGTSPSASDGCARSPGTTEVLARADLGIKVQFLHFWRERI